MSVHKENKSNKSKNKYNRLGDLGKVKKQTLETIKKFIEMKRTFLLICTLLCANVLFAQEQLATLKHNDSIRVYYGADAFKQAYNAAVNGDVITLSDGIFNTTDVRKGITLRGNGACGDTSRNAIGTYFLDQFYVRGLGDSLQFSAEGIYFQSFHAGTSGSDAFYNTKFTKCRITSCYGYGIQAMNCVMPGVGGSSSHQNIYTNCVLNGLPDFSICNNCIMKGSSPSNTIAYNNCIVIKANTSGGSSLNSGAVRDCILIGGFTATSPASSGNVAMSISDVFENWNGNTITTDLEAYVLKSSVSDTIVGFDGSEVGIFGGFMPFEKWTPTYSVIKRCNVSNRTTADGKLSVDIEVVTE